MPVLRVIVGPDTGRSADVRDAPVTMGRGEDCGLRVTDEHVSVVHAVVEPFEGAYRVRDLESTNGTVVNGQRALERRLMFGDVIMIGETMILFGTGGETADTETVGTAETPLPGDTETA